MSFPGFANKGQDANLTISEYSYGHWKGYPGENAYPSILCELPSL